MSDNPFKSQSDEPSPFATPVSPVSPGAASPQSAPGALTPILVFCLILGIFGLIGTCLGGAGLAMMSASEQLFENVPMPEEQKEFNKLNIAAQKGSLVPNIVLLVINLCIAPMLIIGTIGCFKRKEASRVFLRLALLAAIIYSVLKIVGTIYAYFNANAALTASIEKLKDSPMYDGLKSQQDASQLITVGSIVFSIVLAVAILGFYLWARSYLNRDNVVKHFAAVGVGKNLG